MLLLAYHFFAHKRQSCYGADVIANLKRADAVFHTFAIQVGVGASPLCVELETYMNILHLLLKTAFVDFLPLDDAVVQGI